LEGKLNRGPVC